jgi:hypothetical protein
VKVRPTSRKRQNKLFLPLGDFLDTKPSFITFSLINSFGSVVSEVFLVFPIFRSRINNQGYHQSHSNRAHQHYYGRAKQFNTFRKKRGVRVKKGRRKFLFQRGSSKTYINGKLIKARWLDLELLDNRIDVLKGSKKLIQLLRTYFDRDRLFFAIRILEGEKARRKSHDQNR